MALLRVYSKMDSGHKIALPRGICKALDIKPGDKLELTVVPKGVLLRSITFPNAVTRRSKSSGSQRYSKEVSIFGTGCRRDIRKAATFGTGVSKARKLIIIKERCPSRRHIQNTNHSGRFATIQKPIANRR